MVMGGNIHSTLPDEEINWFFSTHPEVITRRIAVHEEQTSKTVGRFADRTFLSWASGEQRKEQRTPNEKHLVTFDSE